MAKLGDLARLIRSKNAGPFMLTFDIMFEDERSYRKVIDAQVLTAPIFASMYQVPVADVMLFEHDTARAIKVSIPRPYVQCDPDDGDAYGGQQHGPLVDLEVPD